MIMKKNILLLSFLALTASSAYSMKELPNTKKRNSDDSLDKKNTQKSPKCVKNWKLTHSFQTHESKKPAFNTLDPSDWNNWYTKLRYSGANAVTHHPSENIIAVGLNKDTPKSDNIQIWNTDKQACIKRIQLDKLGAIHALAFSPCGEYIISISYNDIYQIANTLIIWDTATWEVMKAKSLKLDGPITSIAWLPSTSYLALTIGSKTMKKNSLLLMDLESPRLYEIKPVRHFGHEKAVSIAWHSEVEIEEQEVEDDHMYFSYKSDLDEDEKTKKDKNLIALGLESGDIIIQNIHGRLMHHIKNAHTKSVSGISFNKSGTMLASVSYDGSIKVFNLENGKLICEGNNHSGQIHDIAWSVYNKIYIASDTLFDKDPHENNITTGRSVFEYSISK